METKERKRNMVWGIVMVVFGLAAFANIFMEFDELLIAAFLALGGLVTLAIYFTDRKDWTLLIPPYVLLVAAGNVAMAKLNILEGEYLAVLILTLVALPFLVVYLLNRANWWALIPAYVMLFVIGLITIDIFNWMPPTWVPFYVLAAVALPFLVVYFKNRAGNWWALIPAYVLLAIGTMVLLIESGVLSDIAVAGYVMLAIAIPFLVVYLNDRQQWWALIPGGITGVIGLSFLAGSTVGGYLLPAFLIILGVVVLWRSFRKK